MNDSPYAPTTPRRNRRKRLLIGIGSIVAVFAVVAGVGIWYFFKDDAPAEVSLEAAAAQVTDATDSAATDDTTGVEDATTVAPSDGATDTTTSTSGPAGAGSIAGNWTVATDIGEFSFEDSTGTFVGFRVKEELSGIGSTTAVGRTPSVDGSITIEGTTLSAGTITADMSQLTTNDNRRDSKARGALETDEFPTATFTLTEPVDLGATAATGEAIEVIATGELTVHGVTKPVSFTLQAQLVDGLVVAVGQLDVVFSDYGVQVPESPVVVSAEDHGVIELQLFLRQG